MTKEEQKQAINIIIDTTEELLCLMNTVNNNYREVRGSLIEDLYQLKSTIEGLTEDLSKDED